MASNARPLWSLLPDGALKRQLLSEIAALAQLARDLSDIWAQEAARTAPIACRAPAPRPSGTGMGCAARQLGKRSDWADAAAPALLPEPGGGGNWSGRKEFGQRKPWGKKGEDWNPPQLGPRPTPVSREDQAARLLMCHMEFMEEMTHEDFDALALQPKPCPLVPLAGGPVHRVRPRSWAGAARAIAARPASRWPKSS
jgi:DNA primase